MDYRELLVKYIRIVVDAEGVNFVRNCDRPDEITPEEWAELQRLSEGIRLGTLPADENIDSKRGE